MRNTKKADPVPIENYGNGEATSDRDEDLADEIRRRCVDEPTVRFPELLTITKVGKSKAYELMNASHRKFDPEFPTGFPLFDSPRSPKVWYRHQAMAWVNGRAKKQRQFQTGTKI